MSAAARWKFGARVVGAIVVAVTIVGAGLWLRATWIVVAAPPAGQLLQADADPGRDPWDTGGDVTTAYRPTPPYSGETTVRVHRGKRGAWLVTTRYRLILRPTDKVAAQLRHAPSDIGYVIPNLPGGYAAAHPRDWEPQLPKGAPALLLTAQTLLVALGLGLYWEARLVRTAGLPWGHIRNFRRLSSLAVPTTTLLVAVVTAVATALAGAWGTALTPPTETPPAAVKTSTPP
ncbi:hypothetical protein [Streptomyces sp. NPDC059649]|uniref:hypothetical protein n=1 Tax=Streptomyces sp. NPDC059649 TaxID=3346895 RepID=UPI0036B6F8AB